MTCMLCARECRGHNLGRPETLEPEPGSVAHDARQPAFTVGARYSDLIKDGRTQAGVLKHMRGEVEELHEEILAVTHPEDFKPGPDGIFGEAVDIMACCADIIRREFPDMPLPELEAMVALKMREKCEKWLRGVEAGKYADRES